MNKFKTTSLILITAASILILIYFLQSLGNFESTYNLQADKTPENGKIEIQKIIYSPLIGEAIINENTGKIFNDNQSGRISLLSKIDYYNKAFLQIINKSLILTITICLILFFVRRSQLKNTSHNL